MASKRKRVTLNEFKAWLEGVEELQPTNWAPSKEQWGLIRAKIDYIKNEPTVQQNTQTSNQLRQALPNIATTMPTGITMPPQVGGVPSSVGLAEMSPEAKGLLSKTVDGKTKTPNIDTTNGHFESSFG